MFNFCIVIFEKRSLEEIWQDLGYSVAEVGHCNLFLLPIYSIELFCFQWRFWRLSFFFLGFVLKSLLFLFFSCWLNLFWVLDICLSASLDWFFCCCSILFWDFSFIKNPVLLGILFTGISFKRDIVLIVGAMYSF